METRARNRESSWNDLTKGKIKHGTGSLIVVNDALLSYEQPYLYASREHKRYGPKTFRAAPSSKVVNDKGRRGTRTLGILFRNVI
jgi:hypothetical protein